MNAVFDFLLSAGKWLGFTILQFFQFSTDLAQQHRKYEPSRTTIRPADSIGHPPIDEIPARDVPKILNGMHSVTIETQEQILNEKHKSTFGWM